MGGDRMTETLQGRVLVAARAEGAALFTNEPLSFWGGYNARTGEIIDTRHELCGVHAAGKILILPHARGSSTGSGILLEALRLGNAPAALILQRPDPILALGAIVGRELYGKTMPLIVLAPENFARLEHAAEVRVDENGVVSFPSKVQRDNRVSEEH